MKKNNFLLSSCGTALSDRALICPVQVIIIPVSGFISVTGTSILLSIYFTYTKFYEFTTYEL
jgi:hypothetical protein